MVNQTDLITMLISIACGGLLGLEREYQNKSAGLRTLVLICLGSTVFTMISSRIGINDDRIAANIITGIGFIGAGVIFKENFNVKGLTTASIIWVAAAVGMMIGIGNYLLGIVLSILVLIILSVFAKLENLLDSINHQKTYTITFTDNKPEYRDMISEMVLKEGLRSKITYLSKTDERLRASFEVIGNKKRFQSLTEKFLSMSVIQEIQH